MQLENAIEKKMKRNPKASAIVRGDVHRKTTTCRLRTCAQSQQETPLLWADAEKDFGSNDREVYKGGTARKRPSSNSSSPKSPDE